jgi:uncharacterized phage-associated protein
MPNSMSEEELFKTLLKKKPEAQIPVKKEVLKAVPAAQPFEVHEKKEPVIETPVETLDIEPVVDSLKNLTASVNMMYGLVKTVIVPVLVLILIVGIAILLKAK